MGAENLGHLRRCSIGLVGLVPRSGTRAGRYWSARRWDDLRLVVCVPKTCTTCAYALQLAVGLVQRLAPGQMSAWLGGAMIFGLWA